MCTACIIYDFTKTYSREDIADFLLNFGNNKRNWFLTETQAREAVDAYLKKIPSAIISALEKEGWAIVITDRNLEEKYGYNYEIYGVTDKEEKRIYIYAHKEGIEYALAHELGHFLDEYLGGLSGSKKWLSIHSAHKALPKIPLSYFTGNIEKHDEFFADCFLLYINDSGLLMECNKYAFYLFERISNNIAPIVEILSKNSSDISKNPIFRS